MVVSMGYFACEGKQVISPTVREEFLFLAYTMAAAYFMEGAM